MNKQPFYYEAEVLFTMTHGGVTEAEIAKALDIGLKKLFPGDDYVDGSAECQDHEHEAGSPDDLM